MTSALAHECLCEHWTRSLLARFLSLAPGEEWDLSEQEILEPWRLKILGRHFGCDLSGIALGAIYLLNADQGPYTALHEALGAPPLVI
jgi:hypothetical protein